MDRDDILRMAREAANGMLSYDAEGEWRLSEKEVERFANLVAAHTKNACEAEIEHHKRRAQIWRNEAYKLGGKPLPWDADEVIAKAVAAEREACARMFEEDSTLDGQDRWELAELIRARGKEQPPQERTPDYLEKCPNCNGPADNGFDRSWPDPNPYFCTKCMKAMEY